MRESTMYFLKEAFGQSNAVPVEGKSDFFTTHKERAR